MEPSLLWETGTASAWNDVEYSILKYHSKVIQKCFFCTVNHLYWNKIVWFGKNITYCEKNMFCYELRIWMSSRFYEGWNDAWTGDAEGGAKIFLSQTHFKISWLGTCLIFIKKPHFLTPKKDTKFWITVPELLQSKKLWSIFLCGSSLMVSENINWIVMQSLAISAKLCFRMRNAWDFFTQLFDTCKIDFGSYILTTSRSRDHWIQILVSEVYCKNLQILLVYRYCLES